MEKEHQKACLKVYKKVSSTNCTSTCCKLLVYLKLLILSILKVFCIFVRKSGIVFENRLISDISE